MALAREPGGEGVGATLQLGNPNSFKYLAQPKARCDAVKLQGVKK